MSSQNDPHGSATPPADPDLQHRYTILRTTKEGPVAPTDVAGQIAREMTRELKRLKAWQDPAPPIPAFRMAFGMDAMGFTQWIQLILIPRLFEIEAGKSDIPKRSMLAAHAVREFDGEDQYGNLIELLRYVDELSGDPTEPFSRTVGRAFAETALDQKQTALLLLAILVAALVGWFGAQQICEFLKGRASPSLYQRIEGIPAPSPAFQDVIADLSFDIAKDASLRPTTLSLVLARDFRQPNRGLTYPLELRANDVFDPAQFEQWLAQHEIDAQSPSAVRTMQSIARVVESMRQVRSRADLTTLPARSGEAVRLGSEFEAEPHLSEKVSLTVLVLSLLLTTVPTMLFVARWLRSRARRNEAAAHAPRTED